MKMEFLFEIFDEDKDGVLEETQVKDFFLCVNTIICNISILILEKAIAKEKEIEWKQESKNRVITHKKIIKNLFI
jgi:hypothetical protein